MLDDRLTCYHHRPRAARDMAMGLMGDALERPQLCIPGLTSGVITPAREGGEILLLRPALKYHL